MIDEPEDLVCLLDETEAYEESFFWDLMQANFNRKRLEQVYGKPE